MLALVKAGPASQCGEIIDHAIRTNSPNTRAILLTTRNRADDAFEELHPRQGSGDATERGAQMQVLEMDSRKLAPYFVSE